MKKTLGMMLAILRSRYEYVASLGNGLYIVRTYRERYGDQSWGVYSSRAKKVVCWGDKYEKLSPSLLAFSQTTYHYKYSTTDYYLFCLRKQKLIDSFGEYSGSSFELCENGYVRGHFLKTVGTGDKMKVVGGWGIFNIKKEGFVIQPQYDKMISLGKGQYYGIKESHREGKETYFLIEINDQGKVTTQRTSKIA